MTQAGFYKYYKGKKFKSIHSDVIFHPDSFIVMKYGGCLINGSFSNLNRDSWRYSNITLKILVRDFRVLNTDKEKELLHGVNHIPEVDIKNYEFKVGDATIIPVEEIDYKINIDMDAAGPMIWSPSCDHKNYLKPSALDGKMWCTHCGWKEK